MFFLPFIANNPSQFNLIVLMLFNNFENTMWPIHDHRCALNWRSIISIQQNVLTYWQCKEHSLYTISKFLSNALMNGNWLVLLQTALCQSIIEKHQKFMNTAAFFSISHLKNSDFCILKIRAITHLPHLFFRAICCFHTIHKRIMCNCENYLQMRE